MQYYQQIRCKKLYVHLLLVIEYLIVRGGKQILKAKSEQVSQKYLFAVHYSDGNVDLFTITGHFSFSHSLVPPASVLCRRFLSLAFRSLFHIPESSVGCGRSCPLVVARKCCRGLRSTGLLHARLPAYIETSDHSHDTGRWPSIATRTR